MAVITSRRSVMTLFSRPTDPHSHRVRLVLAEKGISYDVVDIEGDDLPEDLIDLNPYNTIPTLVDRELVLYDVRTIMDADPAYTAQIFTYEVMTFYGFPGDSLPPA